MEFGALKKYEAGPASCELAIAGSSTFQGLVPAIIARPAHRGAESGLAPHSASPPLAATSSPGARLQLAASRQGEGCLL